MPPVATGPDLPTEDRYLKEKPPANHTQDRRHGGHSVAVPPKFFTPKLCCVPRIIWYK